MGSTFGGIDVGLRALLAAQAKMMVHAQNTANVNTAGYTRQRANLAAEGPAPAVTDRNPIGYGVRLDSIERMRDALVDLQYRAATSSHGEQEAKASALSQAEAAFPFDDQVDIAAALTRFVGAFSDLASDPTSLAAREVVLQSAGAFAARLRTTAAAMDTVTTAIGDQLSSSVDRINTIAAQIGEINRQIAITGPDATAAGAGNLLLDRRDMLLDELAGYGTVESRVQGDGMLVVMFGGGALVSGSQVQELSMAAGASGRLVPAYATTGPIVLSGGSLTGIVNARDVSIAGYRAKIGLFAKGVADAVNTLHAGAYDGNGTVAGNLFSYNAADPAGTIALNASITSALKIAAGATANAGDGTRAAAIAALRDSRFLNGGTQTPGDAFSSIVVAIGADASTAANNRDADGLIVEHLSSKRESTSGVNLDEEAAAVMTAQRAYQAASRLVSIADQMLQELLDMVR